MKIMHIVGNRPQFIKLSPVSRELRKRGHEDIIIHTGQHFDDNMSDVFFEEMGIPMPDENLHISGGSHAQMTAQMMVGLEPVLKKYEPDMIMIYGDTNSTLAAAVTAKKLGMNVAHVEAGVRTGVEINPEEINRKCVDHISDILFAPDRRAVDNLVKENLGDRTFFSGDVMYDSYLFCRNEAMSSDKYMIKDVPDKYVLMTWHRQENTDDDEGMKKIINMIKEIDIPVVFPMHPRTRKTLQNFGLWDEINSIPGLRIMNPVGYMEIINLMNGAEWILTDSGGLSKESYYSGKRCVYFCDFEVWPDLEREKWIIHLKENPKDTLAEVNELCKIKASNDEQFYGDGRAASKIADILEKPERQL